MSLAFLRGVVFYDEDMSQRSNKHFEMSYVDDASAYAGVAQGGDYAYDKIVVRDKKTYDLLGTYLVEKHGRYVYSLQGNQVPSTSWLSITPAAISCEGRSPSTRRSTYI